MTAAVTAAVAAAVTAAQTHLHEAREAPVFVGMPPLGEEKSAVHGEVKHRFTSRAAVEAQHCVARNLRTLDVEHHNARSGVDVLRPG